MTIIAAAIDPDGTIYMGGDGISIWIDEGARINREPKVFQVGGWLMGATGSVRMCDIVEHQFDPPAPIGRPLTIADVVKDFVPLLREAMQVHGGEVIEQSQRLMDGRLLAGCDGKLFEIDKGYGVLAPLPPYHAIGCAAQEALAAMFTVHLLTNQFSRFKEVSSMHTSDLVICALTAAAEFNLNIRRPFHVLKLALTERPAQSESVSPPP